MILINAFQKKTKKTPKSEIELAKKLKRQYFIDKKLKAQNEKDNRKIIFSDKDTTVYEAKFNVQKK